MKVDIRIAVDFPKHPKTVRLRNELGSEAVDALLQLWCYAAQRRTKGILHDMDHEDFRIASGYRGSIKKFLGALQRVGFMDRWEGVWVLHDWPDHQPFIFYKDERSRQSKRAAKKRWGNGDNDLPDAPRNAEAMPDGCGSHTKRNAPLPLPIPSPTPLPNNGPPAYVENYLKLRRRNKKRG